MPKVYRMSIGNIKKIVELDDNKCGVLVDNPPLQTYRNI